MLIGSQGEQPGFLKSCKKMLSGNNKDLQKDVIPERNEKGEFLWDPQASGQDFDCVSWWAWD